MGQYFTAEMSDPGEGRHLLTIGFGEQARNSTIVVDAVETLRGLALDGGKAILINGPTTNAAAMAIAHSVAHKYGYVACYDPKLGAYVVVISHDPEVKVGRELVL